MTWSIQSFPKAFTWLFGPCHQNLWYAALRIVVALNEININFLYAAFCVETATYRLAHFSTGRD